MKFRRFKAQVYLVRWTGARVTVILTRIALVPTSVNSAVQMYLFLAADGQQLQHSLRPLIFATMIKVAIS